MHVVTVRFTTAPADNAPYLAFVACNAAQSLAEESGRRRFDVCTATEKPGEFFLYELYDDADAFEVHKHTDHFREFDRDSAALVKSKNVTIHKLELDIPA